MSRWNDEDATRGAAGYQTSSHLQNEMRVATREVTRMCAGVYDQAYGDVKRASLLCLDVPTPRNPVARATSRASTSACARAPYP